MDIFFLQEKTFDTNNKETIFITLEKPQLYVMPAAVDKGKCLLQNLICEL